MAGPDKVELMVDSLDKVEQEAASLDKVDRLAAGCMYMHDAIARCTLCVRVCVCVFPCHPIRTPHIYVVRIGYVIPAPGDPGPQLPRAAVLQRTSFGALRSLLCAASVT